ncbi:MAG: tetratricopeptide repeat protein [Bacteroidales bacterium]|nr:tetratricopeptide repeat protein [Bacteroidales bacterium]
MKTYLKPLILTAVVCLAMTACNKQSKRVEQAQALYNEGVELREQHRSEEAAEKFLQGLAIVQRSDKTTEVIQLEGQLCDNLGAMYLKHGLFEDAFKQHQQALTCFKQTADSTGMMNAYRNSGRAVRAQEQYTQAKQYYDSAFRIATFVADTSMLGDLYLEMGRDYYMETGNFAKGIESVNQALKIGLNDNDTDIAHMTLGILYYYTRENEKAKSYLNQALRSERAGLKMSVYQTLYAIAESEGDYQQAMQYHKQFAASLMQADAEHANETMLRIKSEYELKAQQSELESLHRNRDLKLYLIIAMAVIALLVILLMVRKKISDHKLEMEHFGRQVERDQNRIHELVSDMETLIRTNDELRRNQQTLPQKDFMAIQKIMTRNKIMTTAQALSEEVNNDSLNFELTDNDWKDFISLTDLIFDGFSQRLLQLYPKLGQWDVRICCLSKNGFSNQVISILLDTQTDSYYKRKTRIKQMKMDLGDDNRTFEEIVNAV